MQGRGQGIPSLPFPAALGKDLNRIVRGHLHELHPFSSLRDKQFNRGFTQFAKPVLNQITIFGGKRQQQFARWLALGRVILDNGFSEDAVVFSNGINYKKSLSTADHTGANKKNGNAHRGAFPGKAEYILVHLVVGHHNLALQGFS